MRLVVMMLGLFAFVAAAQPTADDVYAEGKQLYDAKQFGPALEKFDEAARLEPDKARWQYNRGLALKKLKRDQESRAAFLESLRLDPTYKQKEIRDKLGDLAPDGTQSRSGEPASSSSSSSGASSGESSCGGAAGCGGAVIALGLFLAFGIRRNKTTGAASGGGRASRGALPAATRTALQQRLEGVGPSLTRLEHAMSLGEDPEARAQLDRAASNFQQARRTLAGGKNVPEEITGALSRAEEASRAAATRLRSLRGAAFDTATGPAIGCFFCARPLPTPQSRHAFTLQARGARTQVLTCAACGRRAASGDVPQVSCVNGEHWATVRGVDPYVFAYSSVVALEEQPAWQLSKRGVDVEQVAGLSGVALAGAAGVAGVAAGVAASQFLDVDALWESAAASGAAEAAARSASSRKQERDWKDHS